MTNLEKQQLLAEIEKHSEIFKKSGRYQYRIRCPICGDSQKDLTDSHCYIKCTDNPDEALLYNCFLCNRGGVVGKKFLMKLGIDSNTATKFTSDKYNKLGSLKNTNIDLITGTPILNSPQVRYIEKRLGPGFTHDDYERFKIIWNWDHIYRSVTNKRILNSLPNDRVSVSFLSDDKSSILTRAYTDEFGRWSKKEIFPSENRAIYTIKSMIDLFTKDIIEVNIAEGVFDVLSIYKNFTYCENSVYIAVLGSDYLSGIMFAIMKGFIGKNVIVRIYLDSEIDDIALKKSLFKYKWLFQNIFLYKNIKNKDVGVKRNEIELLEKKV